MSAYTDEELETIRTMAAKGYSGQEISDRLPKKSRQAVVSLCSRKGWMLGRKSHVTKPDFAEPKVQTPPRIHTPRHDGDTEGLRLPFDQLTALQCRYPVSTFYATSHLFCGHQKLEGGPYCERHHQMAFVSYAVARARQRARVGS